MGDYDVDEEETRIEKVLMVYSHILDLREREEREGGGREERGEREGVGGGGRERERVREREGGGEGERERGEREG